MESQPLLNDDENSTILDESFVYRNRRDTGQKGLVTPGTAQG
jgi:hypothetical protein